jgi:hypothetical protein
MLIKPKVLLFLFFLGTIFSMVHMADVKGKAVMMEKEEEGERGEIVQETKEGEIVPKTEQVELTRKDEIENFLNNPLGDFPYGLNRLGELVVFRLFHLHYVDFFDSIGDDGMRHARMVMAVTAHIYFLAKFAHYGDDTALADKLK